MKISLNLIKYDDKLYGLTEGMKLDNVDELVHKIGVQLGAVEEVKYLGDKYKGIVVAKVATCEKHPNADKLKVCMLDDAGVIKGVERDANGHVQVVCGAPNVREGLLVAWLPPGSTVPNTVDKEPFVLGSRELRGVVSNGMIASAHELGISDDHSGIVEISTSDSGPEYKPGDDFATVFGLDDYVIDIENKMFTHRPDCFGVLGVAREIAGITGLKFNSPAIYAKPKTIVNNDKGLQLTIKNELPELVPRFMAQVFENVEVGPSPLWMQIELSKVGIRPINNIVDITNFFMLLTGQPLHAYDYDKVKALSGGEAVIVIRHPNKGEKVKLLNGKEIEPRDKAIMIATDQQLIGIGGVMGGAETEVDENTKNVILECANFDMYSIRRTSMEHGLFTDAVTRFNKGQSPLQCERVLAWAQGDVICNSGPSVLPGNVYDDQHNLAQPAVVEVAVGFVNDRLGLKLSAKEMATLLTNVEFEVTINGDELSVTAPFWRTDIEIREDVVEEVGRLYGYDKLPLVLPKRSIQPAVRDDILDLKMQIGATLSGLGANEVLTYNFVHGDLLTSVGQNPDDAFRLSNALSPDLQYYRLSLIPSLLEKIHQNIKAGYDEFALFEINKAHNKQHASDDEGVPKEFQMLSLVYAADDKADHPGGAAFYQVRMYLDGLADALGLTLTYTAIDKEPDFPVAKPYDPVRSALISEARTGTSLGMIGEFKRSVVRKLKLPTYCGGFEISVESLLKLATQKSYQPMSKYPEVVQDMTLRVPSSVQFSQLYSLLSTQLTEQIDDNTHASLEPIDIYQKEPGANTQNVTFRLHIVRYDKTMVANEVNTLLDQLAAKANADLGAERV